MNNQLDFNIINSDFAKQVGFDTQECVALAQAIYDYVIEFANNTKGLNLTKAKSLAKKQVTYMAKMGGHEFFPPCFVNAKTPFDNSLLKKYNITAINLNVMTELDQQIYVAYNTLLLAFAGK